MLGNVFQKFSGGCMMVFRRQGESVQFLGTAFLVHEEGYLLSVSHILPEEGQLIVVPGDSGSEFVPLNQETVTSIPVTVVRRSLERDLVLLKMEQDIGIRMPDHFIGTAASSLTGNSVMALGYAFGHQSLHTLVAMNAVVSGKVLSNNQTRILLFDSMIHHGDRGGPLVSVEDGLIIGIINGRFDPQEASKEYTDGRNTVETNTNISYAVAIDYGVDLMEKEGLKPH